MIVANKTPEIASSNHYHMIRNEFVTFVAVVFSDIDVRYIWY